MRLWPSRLDTRLAGGFGSRSCGLGGGNKRQSHEMHSVYST